MEDHERKLEQRRYNDHRDRGAGFLIAACVLGALTFITTGVVSEKHGLWALLVVPPLLAVIITFLVLSSRSYGKAREIENMFVYTHGLPPPDRE